MYVFSLHRTKNLNIKKLFNKLNDANVQFSAVEYYKFWYRSDTNKYRGSIADINTDSDTFNL